MKKTTVVPAGTKVLQYPAGQEIKAIVDGNEVYYIAETRGAEGGAAEETADGGADAGAKPKRGASKAPAAEPKQEAAPKVSAKAEKAVKKVFDDLADGAIDDEDTAVDEIIEGTGADEKLFKKGIRKVVDKFMADSDLAADDMVAEVLALISGGGAEENPPPAKGRGSKPAAAPAAKAKLKTVEDVSTLEVDDVVDVLLSTEDEPDGEWYKECVVTKVVRGVPTITFPDEDVLKYDADAMLEIKLHS